MDTPPVAPSATSVTSVTSAQGEPLEEVIGRVMPAVVLVETQNGRGSAFFVAPDTLLTNVHVVGGHSSVILKRTGGASQPAMVAARAPEFDLAVLKVSPAVAGQAVIALGGPEPARVGQDVIAIGSALGTLQNTVTRGIVSGLRRAGNAVLVQTDAAVNPGNSGGPLLDRSGTAIGITTMGYAGRQGLNFAVSAEHARALLTGRPSFAPPTSSAAQPQLQQLPPAQPSDAERARADGTKAYAEAMNAMGRRADNLDRYWRRFREVCHQGPIAGRFEREWFAVFDPRSLQSNVPAGCGQTFSDLAREAGDIRDGVARAEQAAHRAGVYPGIRRDVRRQYRLDHPDFDR
jgi:hypothetical protein